MTNLRGYWWPFPISTIEREALEKFRNEMENTRIQFDVKNANSVSDILAYLMSQNITDIIERDALSWFCHVLNGWGNGKLKGNEVINWLARYVKNSNSQSEILQYHEDGDFHPWQSFAYAIMAGIDVDTPILKNSCTIRSLALSSTSIKTDDGVELGHLLFTLTHIFNNSIDLNFNLPSNILTLEKLMDYAIKSHENDPFTVCRKFHLTEGLCAAASIPELMCYKEKVESFLYGQLDILFLLGSSLKEAISLELTNKPIIEGSLLHRVRSSFKIGHFIENYCYLAGHIIELFFFAGKFGYPIKNAHWNVVYYVANILNHYLPSFLPHINFLHFFPILGHYRRAITLLLLLEDKNKDFSKIHPQDLQNYAVDFDKVKIVPNLWLNSKKPKSVEEGGIFDIGAIVKLSRKKFLEVISKYDELSDVKFKSRGLFEHFRRIIPPYWPRSLHYEILDYGDDIGIEIHLESDEVLCIKEIFPELINIIKKEFINYEIKWDDQWSRKRGRLCIIYPKKSTPEEIAKGMKNLINLTFESIDSLARNIPVSKYKYNIDVIEQGLF